MIFVRNLLSLSSEITTSTTAVLLLLASALLITTMANEHAVTVSRGNNFLTTKLYEQLAKEDGNVFFSPISLHTVLSLLHQGANTDSESALRSVLGLPGKADSAEGFQHVMSTLNNVPDVTLEIANKVYAMDGYKLKEGFAQIAQKAFFSGAENIDFSKSTAAAQSINGWVEEKTKNKIKDLISPDMLNELTRLVLVNAIYFKGDWADKFDAKLTKTEPFYTSETDSINCQMMHKKKKYLFKDDKDLEAKILRIPYKNKDVSLVIVLPNERTGIKKLEEKLKGYDLSALTNGMYQVEVNLSLPRFKVETTMDLNEPLKQLGLGNLFDETKADLSGLLDSGEQLYVSQVVQKAFIEVNEEGAEAAAATGMIAMTRSLKIQPKQIVVFKADHPFNYFIVRHLERYSKDLVLFAGKLKTAK